MRAELAAHLPSSYTFNLTPEFIQSVGDPATQALLWAYYASDLLEAYEASQDPALLEAYLDALANARALAEAAADPAITEVIADALDELRDEAPEVGEAEAAEVEEDDHGRHHPGNGEVEDEEDHNANAGNDDHDEE